MQQVNSSLPFSYNIGIEVDKDQQFVVNWGQDKDWQTRMRTMLDSAFRISLIPKEKNGGPIVTVALDDNKRWVIFSRVVGQVASATGRKVEMRLYCIGWQKKIKGVNVKSLQWIYPGGTIECSDEPTLVKYFLSKGQGEQ